MISVYFLHDTRSRGVVLHAWHEALAVPRVGDLVKTTWRELWRVLEVTWLDGVQGRSAELLVTTVEPGEPPSRPEANFEVVSAECGTIVQSNRAVISAEAEGPVRCRSCAGVR